MMLRQRRVLTLLHMYMPDMAQADRLISGFYIKTISTLNAVSTMKRTVPFVLYITMRTASWCPSAPEVMSAVGLVKPATGTPLVIPGICPADGLPVLAAAAMARTARLL